MSIRQNTPDSGEYIDKYQSQTTGHVFVSYVREDRVLVDRLAKALTEAGVVVWLDHDAIRPGTRWKNAIRHAIEQGAFFLACFSDEFDKKLKSYMNEEITLAIEELRQYPTDHAWFIPVKLTECDIPDRDIGGGETLRGIQWISMADDWDSGIASLVSLLSAAKRHQPVSGNPVVLDTRIPMRDRCDKLVEQWIAAGRGHDWLVVGKPFFAVCCWMYDRNKTNPNDTSYNSDYADYLNAAMGAIGGLAGWDDMLMDHIVCDLCRTSYRLENSILCTSCMEYLCFKDECKQMHSAICFGTLKAEFTG